MYLSAERGGLLERGIALVRDEKKHGFINKSGNYLIIIMK